MELLTKVDIKPSDWKICYQNKIVLLGSCFADNIGKKFAEHYFQTTINPYGTLYNPASILSAIQEGSFRVLHHHGLWHSMSHHGSFSHMDRSVLIDRCEQSHAHLARAMHEANILIVTLGTSWVYEYEGMVVANCHKMPASEFVRRRMTVEEIVNSWERVISNMPDKRWIFTVSPIRHLKDGLHENQISKGILLQAVEKLCQIKNVSYFPAYEIMLDELRDYRFYLEDMVHPSSLAVDYIWQRFVDTYMNSDTQLEMRTLHQLWRDRHHTILHPTSPEAQKFMQSLQQRIQQYQVHYPWID
jgi:hypothetical protein